MSRNSHHSGKGRRELNKEDKLRRISNAARMLFVTRGFDETSTREIAKAAGVAQATLFLYAADKRDLLFLTVNDELELASYRAGDAIRPDASLLENLSACLGVVYQFFGRERALARLTLREMMFYDAGPHGRRFVQTRQRMISLCSQIARLAQDKGEIGRTYNADSIGAVMFAIFQIEVRKWLAGRATSVAEGLRRLRDAHEIVLNGLSPAGKSRR